MSIYARAVPLPGAGSGLRDSESELIPSWRITGICPGLNASSKTSGGCDIRTRQRTMFRSDVTDNTVLSRRHTYAAKIGLRRNTSALSARFDQITPWHIPCSNETTTLALQNRKSFGSEGNRMEPKINEADSKAA